MKPNKQNYGFGQLDAEKVDGKDDDEGDSGGGGGGGGSKKEDLSKTNRGKQKPLSVSTGKPTGPMDVDGSDMADGEYAILLKRAMDEAAAEREDDEEEGVGKPFENNTLPGVLFPLTRGCPPMSKGEVHEVFEDLLNTLST